MVRDVRRTEFSSSVFCSIRDNSNKLRLAYAEVIYQDFAVDSDASWLSFVSAFLSSAMRLSFSRLNRSVTWALLSISLRISSFMSHRQSPTLFSNSDVASDRLSLIYVFKQST